MKILMILESDFPPDIRVENEIEQLLKLGFEIKVATCTLSDRPITEEYSKGCTVYRKKISSFIYKTSVGALKFPFYFNFWRKFVSNILDNEKFDAIHVHDLPLVKVGVEMKNKYKVPLVVDLHENWPAHIAEALHTQTFLGKLLSSNKQWVQYEKTILKKADRIITVIDEMKNRIVSQGIYKDKVFVVSNVLNISTFPDIKAITPKETILFYGGGIDFSRGLQIAIKGIDILKARLPNIKLVVAGNGKYVTELKELVKNLNIENKVIFKGHMKQDDLLTEMTKSSITLIPHLRSVQSDNSSPNKLFQYMYAEKPILSSDCTSLKRVIEANNVGIVYKDNDSNAFAEALLKLIELNKDNIIGKRGKKVVLEKYNWNNQGDILNEVYKNIKN